MNQEQIERLWKWAGFRWVRLHAVWAYPNEPRLRTKLPDLTWEAIEKWFVPKLLNDYQIDSVANKDFKGGHTKVSIWYLGDPENVFEGQSDSFKDAFLAALLKLIDAGEKNAKG